MYATTATTRVHKSVSVARLFLMAVGRGCDPRVRVKNKTKREKKNQKERVSRSWVYFVRVGTSGGWPIGRGAEERTSRMACGAHCIRVTRAGAASLSPPLFFFLPRPIDRTDTHTHARRDEQQHHRSTVPRPSRSRRRHDGAILYYTPPPPPPATVFFFFFVNGPTVLDRCAAPALP